MNRPVKNNLAFKDQTAVQNLTMQVVILSIEIENPDQNTKHQKLTECITKPNYII